MHTALVDLLTCNLLVENVNSFGFRLSATSAVSLVPATCSAAVPTCSLLTAAPATCYIAVSTVCYLQHLPRVLQLSPQSAICSTCHVFCSCPYSLLSVLSSCLLYLNYLTQCKFLFWKMTLSFLEIVPSQVE